MKKLLALLLAVVFGVTACGNSNTTTQGTKQENGTGGEEVKVGMLGVISGPVAEYGVASTNGTLLAFEALNKNNHLEGKTIVPVLYDSEADQTKSVNLFNKLASNDKVNAFVGGVVSSVSLAVAPIANEERIPMITPTGTHLGITPDYDNVFRACFIDPYQGVLAGQFAVENLQAKKVAILYNVGVDYSVGLAEEFKKVVEASGVEVVNNEGYNDEDKDFGALASKLKASNPDMVFLPDYYNKVGIIVGQLRAAGVNAAVLGGDGWDGVLTNYAKEVEGCYYLTHFSVSDESEKVQAFVKAYREKYNVDPSSFAALGYDAGLIMAEAIKNAKSTSREDITGALKEIVFEGVTGTIQFDQDGNPKNKDVTVIKVVDGKAVVETKIKGK